MTLTSGQKITILTTIGGVILAAALTFFITEWRKPDIRYKQGSYYRLEKMAVMCLTLQNHGKSDAKNIKIAVGCAAKIINIQTSWAAYPFQLISGCGSLGSDHVTGKISSLAPGQILHIYFGLENKLLRLRIPDPASLIIS